MKRVLIINAAAIGEKTGTGTTLSNLWSDYPQKDLLQLLVNNNEQEHYNGPRTVVTPTSFCYFPYVIANIRRKRSVGKSDRLTLNANVVQTGLKAKCIDVVRGVFDSWPVDYKCIDNEVKRFKPEIIYTCGASIRILKVALHYSLMYDVPIVLHLMDDWPETIYSTSFFSIPFHSYINRLLRMCARRSSTSFSISEALCEKYERALGCSFLPLMNPSGRIVEFPSVRNCREFRFIYAGSLSLDRWKSLAEIAKAISCVRKEGHDVRFDLFVPQSSISDKLVSLFSGFGAVLNPYVEHDQLVKEYDKCDGLVYTESFDENIKQFIRYSLSTKVPEYMSTGKPILALLPADIHSSQYIKKRNAGYVVNNPSELCETIEEMICNVDNRLEIAKKALEVAKSEHSLQCEIGKLYSVVNDF